MTGPGTQHSRAQQSGDRDAPSVSVIICAYTTEREADIRTAVASVLRQTLQPDQVIVVIDHNPLLQTTLADLPVTVIANTSIKGLSGARNTGTEAAVGDVVAYLDDDAEAADDWLEQLIAPFADRLVVAVGGWANARWDEIAPPWFPPEYAWVVGCSHHGLPTERSETRNVIGCNMAFRRDAVIAAGGFNTAIGRTSNRPLGCEETELCIRLRQADDEAVVLLEPRAIVNHRVRAERGEWRYFLRRCRAEGYSKAHVSRLVGANAGLSSERAYVAEVLPQACARAMREVIHRPGPSTQRLFALLGGLLMTTAGFVEYSLRRPPNERR